MVDEKSHLELIERQLGGGIKREERGTGLCLYNETYLATAFLSRPAGL